MNWDAIKKLDTRWIDSVWQEARTEQFYEAYLKSRDLAEWARYLQANPPSPETLAIALMLGREKYESTKGRRAGQASGNVRRKKAQLTPERVAKLYQQEMATGKEKRNVAAVLANRFGVTSHHIRDLHRQATKQT